MPGTVELFLALTVLAGRLVPLALTIAAGSMLLGLLRIARDHAHQVAHDLDPVGVAQALTIAVVAVAVLAGTHHVRERTRAAREAAAERARRELEDHAAAERAREQERAELDAERARAAAREQRAHELDLQRARAYEASERARLDAETRAAERAHELAMADRARQDRAHDQPTRERAPRARPARDDVAATRRKRAHEQWAARERSDRPMTGDELAPLLGVSPAQARRTARAWRDETKLQEAAHP